MDPFLITLTGDRREWTRATVRQAKHLAEALARAYPGNHAYVYFRPAQNAVHYEVVYDAKTESFTVVRAISAFRTIEVPA